MLARCPNCRVVFNAERTGQQNCPTCGKPLVVPEQPAQPVAATPLDPPAGLPDFSRRRSEPKPTARRREPLGAAPRAALLHRLAGDDEARALRAEQALLAPRSSTKTGEQTTFAVLTYSVFAIIEQSPRTPDDRRAAGRALQPFQGEARQQHSRLGCSPILQSSQHPSIGAQLLSLLVAPLIALVFLYLNAAVTHFFAMIFEAEQEGLRRQLHRLRLRVCPPRVLIAISNT